jgi:23S rRNA pseudouridine2457 synthase
LDLIKIIFKNFKIILIETEASNRYFIVNKPYNMLSQFVPSPPNICLANLDFNFPKGTHAIGRLDNNSEGLLILTTNKKITKLLFESEIKHIRTYLVQINYKIEEAQLQQLRDGVKIRISKTEFWQTSPCTVLLANELPTKYNITNNLHERVPFSWLLITMTEGKFHQVRKMMMAIKHKCKRLIRISIEDIALENLQPGCVKEFSEKDFFNLLKL